MTKSIELSCAASSSRRCPRRAPAPGWGRPRSWVPSARDWAIWWVRSPWASPSTPMWNPELLELMLDADDVRAQLLALVEADAKAFVPLSAAYGLPGNSDEEKAHKAQVLEACLRDACAVPLDIMRACARAIELCERFAELEAHSSSRTRAAASSPARPRCRRRPASTSS